MTPDAMPPDRATKSSPFSLVITIAPADIDALGHVNNVVYLRWAQDVAAAHWLGAATADEHASITWIAVRHEIDYLHAALPGDEIVARTWVGLAEAVRFERQVEIVRAADGKVLARARTLWCPVRRDTGRITRVSATLRDRFSTGPADA